MKWENGSIRIRGEDVPTSTGMIAHRDLKYFSDNPRIYSVVRIDDAIPDQEEIERQLWKMDHVKELRLDIKENGGLIDPIIVKDGTFEVLEGNSRLAAYRKLAEDDPIRWGEMKCTLLPESIEESLVFALLGQYHVKGKKSWAPYEQAGFLYRRHKQHEIGVSELGKDLGISSEETGKLIHVYQTMIDKDDTDTSHWSHYYQYFSSNKIKELYSEYAGFDEAILAQIKSGEIRAVDIRDKLAKIPVRNKKIITGIISGDLTIDDAYDQVEASGSTDFLYTKINKFRVWFGSEETRSSLKKADPEVRQRIAPELRRLTKYTKRLRKILDK